MSQSQSVRILIVDDEEPQLKALCQTLTDQGFEVVGFNNGESALKAMEDTQFDLLLSDLMMPKIDGIALLTAALEKDANLVGIIMTGQGTIDTAVGAMKSGALDYILKPFKISAIMPVISRAMTVRQLRMEKAALQEHLSERTAELEVANMDLAAFSSTVSHDLRAPVRAMGGLANILATKYASQIPTEGQQLLERIKENAKRMTQLIEGLLSFASLGKKSLNRTLVNPAGIARTVAEELRSEITDRLIEIEIEDLPGCLGDVLLLKQVFINIIGNAIKYSRGRSPARIKVGARKEKDEQVYFVEDNGAGFEMEYAGKLFQVFQRLHSVEEFEGTGIGLASVQRIINRHGGRIWAESKVGHGSTFFFTLGGSHYA